MAIEIDEANPTFLRLRMTGRLTARDYEQFVPRVDALIEQRGPIRLLVEMQDFHGWELAAAWSDTKFGLRHFHDIERLAVVGEKAWQHGMAVFCKPFTKAEVRYFDVAEADAGRAWIAS